MSANFKFKLAMPQHFTNNNATLKHECTTHRSIQLFGSDKPSVEFLAK